MARRSKTSHTLSGEMRNPGAQTVSDRCALLRQPYSLVSPNLHHPGSCAASTVLLNLGTASVRTSAASVDPLLSQFSNARAADSLKKGLAR
jgi:hypothetical protein